MNGVRRFFAATNVVAPSPSPPPPPKDSTPEPTTEHPSLPPLNIDGGKQLYPPPKSSESSPDQVTSPTSLGTVPNGLPGRIGAPKSPRRKAARPDLNGILNSPSSQIRPSFESSRNSPRASPVGLYSPNGTSRAFEALKSTLSMADVTWKPSPVVNTRDDLLISLLASEAVVDSIRCEILPAEEVEDLKREQQLLSSRLGATKKKLSLETKLRDAALNLQQLQTVKRISKQTSEQLDAANRKVEAATKELSRLLEQAGDVDRKLLEHRSGVLSLAVRNLETKVATLNGEPSEDVGSRSVSVAASRGLNSPVSSVTSSSERAKFDGAHLFAGHADAVVPGSLRRKVVGSAQISALDLKFKEAESAASAQISALDIKLKEAENAASAQISALDIKLKNAENVAQVAQNKYVELQRQMQQLGNVKGDTERNLEFDLQTAQETISKMEKEMRDMEQALAQQVSQQDGLEQARQGWERTRVDWDKERQELRKESDLRAETIVQLEARVRELEEQVTKGSDLSDMLRAKDEEIVRLLNHSQDERQRWESQKILFQQERQEALDRFRNDSNSLEAAAKEQLDVGLQNVYELIQNHRVVTSPADNSLPGLISAINAHVDSINNKLKLQERENYELDSARKKYEEDVRNGWEIRERLGKDVEEARKEREEARKELRALEAQMKEEVQLRQSQTFKNVASSDSKYSDDVNKIINMLRPLWSALPSVEARALRAGKSSSLAELDVRSLKSLYDPKAGFNSPTVSGEFSIDDFVTRVQALMADDRALIERLIRFAQSHDLLRNNAERAQKLAQDSNKGLETYQTQVKTLEERNANLTRKQLTMLDEINELQQSVDIVSQQKRDMEAELEELRDKIRILSDLKTQPASPDGEIAALEADKAKLEEQLVELQKKLDGTESELERVATSEFSQRATLLDELNSLQQENNKLRDQLRAKK